MPHADRLGLENILLVRIIHTLQERYPSIPQKEIGDIVDKSGISTALRWLAYMSDVRTEQPTPIWVPKTAVSLGAKMVSGTFKRPAHSCVNCLINMQSRKKNSDRI